MTALDLIKRALRMLGALGVGETLDAELSNNALGALNSMLESWSVEGLMVYATLNETFPLSSGVQNYTIGSGGTFNTVRPDSIESAFFSLSNNDYTVRVITVSEWNDIVNKSTGATFPEVMRYDATMPLGVIRLWPVPNGGSLTIAKTVPLQSFSNLTDVVVLPKGYERAIASNLAIELAPEYERSITPELAKIARDSKAIVKSINPSGAVLKVDYFIRDRFNPLTGVLG